ncbi:MAG: hypothetical protein HY226_06095 [Candidatus Vogelbacteria bacterium]|nr:hypothetical protein [Candidatus Vogelbacteria bacterium]
MKNSGHKHASNTLELTYIYMGRLEQYFRLVNKDTEDEIRKIVESRQNEIKNCHICRWNIFIYTREMNGDSYRPVESPWDED